MLVTVVTVTQWALITVFTVYMLMRHAHKDVAWPVKVFTFIGWFMGFSIIAILPLDILIVSRYSHTMNTCVRLKTMIW